MYCCVLLINQHQTRSHPPSKNSSNPTVSSKYPGLVFGLKRMCSVIWERDRANCPSIQVHPSQLCLGQASLALYYVYSVCVRVYVCVRRGWGIGLCLQPLWTEALERRESLILFGPGIWFWLLSLMNQAKAYPTFCSVIPTTHTHKNTHTHLPLAAQQICPR